MIKRTLNNLLFLQIKDERTNKSYFGCDQQWYSLPWQKLAGCGPSVASNIVLYNKKNTLITKNDAIKQMNEMWIYVTPTMRGVNNTKIFIDGMNCYLNNQSTKVLYDVLDVPEDCIKRPQFKEITEFIMNSLNKDVPIAFLNLCNGKEKILDKWHWVTISSIEFDEEENCKIEILDEGKRKTIDLYLWYHTTTLGGGLVSYYF